MNGITLAIFSLSEKMPVVNIWLIINVIGLINVTFIVLIIFEEMPSKQQQFIELYLHLY